MPNTATSNSPQLQILYATIVDLQQRVTYIYHGLCISDSWIMTGLDLSGLGVSDWFCVIVYSVQARCTTNALLLTVSLL